MFGQCSGFQGPSAQTKSHLHRLGYPDTSSLRARVGVAPPRRRTVRKYHCAPRMG